MRDSLETPRMRVKLNEHKRIKRNEDKWTTTKKGGKRGFERQQKSRHRPFLRQRERGKEGREGGGNGGVGAVPRRNGRDEGARASATPRRKEQRNYETHARRGNKFRKET